MSWHVMTCHDICHIVRHASTFAWDVGTWHKGDVTKADTAAQGSEPEWWCAITDFGSSVWYTYPGSNLIYVSSFGSDPIYTSHSSLSYSTISTLALTHTRRGLSMIIRASVLLWFIPLLLASSSGKLKSVEGTWSEYPPTSYQQIFQTHNYCQCYLFWGGTCTHSMMIASWSDCHHTLVTILHI